MFIESSVLITLYKTGVILRAYACSLHCILPREAPWAIKLYKAQNTKSHEPIPPFSLPLKRCYSHFFLISHDVYNSVSRGKILKSILNSKSHRLQDTFYENSITLGAQSIGLL